jgi:hypothetical protein
MKRAVAVVLMCVLGPPAALAQAKVTPMGELRTNLVLQRLDDVYVESPDAEPEIYLNVSRGVIGAQATFTEAWSARLTLDVRETTRTYTTAAGDSVTIDNSHNAYEVRAFDAYGTYTSDTLGDFTFGTQKSSFGVRRSYDVEDGFYFGAMTQFQSWAVRSGVVAPRVLGLAWHRAFGERVDATLMANNSTIFVEPDPRNGKDISLVLEGWAVEDVLRVTASGMVGPRGDETPGGYDTTQVAWSGAAFARIWKLRLLSEVFSRYLLEESTGLGYSVNLGGDVGLKGAADRLELMARYESWEPDFEVDADGRMEIAGAANLYWATPKKSVVMTGLFYEVTVPQDLNAAITHDAFVQARFKF